MKVSNMLTTAGKAAPNQFIIFDSEYKVFRSYGSNIIKIDLVRSRVYLDINKWNYSATTSKYRNQFLGETTKETQAKIDSGEYILADLN